MSLSCGIVGLPNAGKSTLYNALTAAGAAVAGYPFCTIERNIGSVAIPDPRLTLAGGLAGSAKTTPAMLEVVDIAGLVRGASRGEGLGNRFLAEIRETDAILHVVRCHDNQAAPHFLGEPDPVRDAGIISAELMLADIATLERYMERLATPARVGDVPAREKHTAADNLRQRLDRGEQVRLTRLSAPETAVVSELRLLTAKAVVFVANVPDPDLTTAVSRDWSAELRRLAATDQAGFCEIYARALAELAEFAPPERLLLARDLGISTDPLSDVLSAAFGALDLVTFFTANRTEARAWTVRRGTVAAVAAGVVHSDFERGFIAAEVLPAGSLALYGSRAEAAKAGALRLEGRDYAVQDGDLLEFRHSG